MCVGVWPWLEWHIRPDYLPYFFYLDGYRNFVYQLIDIQDRQRIIEGIVPGGRLWIREHGRCRR